MSYDDSDGAAPDRRWQWVVIAVLVALLLLLLGYCTIRSVDDNNTPIGSATSTSSSPAIPPTTVVGTTGATEPGPIVIDPTDTATGGTSTRTSPPVVTPVTTKAVPPTTSTGRRTPADAPQTDGGSTGPGNGIPRVLGGLALIVAAVLSGAFAATRWRQARR